MPRDDSTDLVKHKALQTTPFKIYLLLYLALFCVVRSYTATGYHKHTGCYFTLFHCKLRRTALAAKENNSEPKKAVWDPVDSGKLYIAVLHTVTKPGCAHVIKAKLIG